GINHPVKDIKNGNIIITSQNHNFAVDRESMLNAGFYETYTSLNDSTVEGMTHSNYPVFSVQFHPEASPGPHDSGYIFNNFFKLVLGR
ncbi:carbamoyl phosphate synthase small subunit, partial [candidate division KSB1 bacterium]